MAVPGLVRFFSASMVAALSLAVTGLTESLARPKSKILAWPRVVTKMFAGLISRWMMPLEWATSSPSAI